MTLFLPCLYAIAKPKLREIAFRHKIHYLAQVYILKKTSKLHHWFNSFGGFSKWVDFDPQLGCMGKGLRLQAGQCSSSQMYKVALTKNPKILQGLLLSYTPVGGTCRTGGWRAPSCREGQRTGDRGAARAWVDIRTLQKQWKYQHFLEP